MASLGRHRPKSWPLLPPAPKGCPHTYRNPPFTGPPSLDSLRLPFPSELGIQFAGLRPSPLCLVWAPALERQRQITAGLDAQPEWRLGTTLAACFLTDLPVPSCAGRKISFRDPHGGYCSKGSHRPRKGGQTLKKSRR